MEEVKIPITIDDSGFGIGAKRIIDRMEDTQKDVEKAKRVIEELSAKAMDAADKFKESSEAVDKLKGELQGLAEGGASAEELIAKAKELGEAQRKAAADGIAALDANQKYWTALGLAGKDIEEVRNQHNELGQAYINMAAQAKQTNTVVDEYSKKLAEEKQKLQEAKEKTEEAERSTEKLTDAKDKASKSSKNLADKLGDVSSGAKGILGPIGDAISGVNGLTKATLRFIATPIGAVLAAISGALAMVTSWFKRTEEGQNAMAVGSAYFTQVLNSLLDVVDNVGEWLYKAFTKPKGALTDLVGFLKGQVINRLKAVGEMAQGIWKILNGDFSEGYNQFINGSIQGITGVTNATGKLSAFMGETNKKAQERMDISRRQNSLDAQERKNLVERAKLEKQISELREKAYDKSIPEKERSKAVKEAQKLTKQMFDEELRLANERYEIIRDTNALSHSNKEDKKKEAEAEAELYRIQSQRSTALKGLMREQNRVDSSSQKAGNAALKQQKEQAAAHAKLTEQELEFQAQLTKIQKEAAAARSAAAIAAEKSAATRERREREAQHAKTISDIEQQEAEIYKAIYEARKKAYEAANKDKKYENDAQGSKGWGKADMEGTLNAQELEMVKAVLEKIAAERDKANAEYERQEKERGDALIASYQSYTDQKLAIDKKYRDDVDAINASIAEAQKHGDQETVEALKRSLAEAAKERAKSQSQLSLEQLKETPEYVRAFEDLGQTSSETLEMLIGMFEEAKEAAAQSMNPEQLREFTSTLQQMYDEINRRDPFKAMAESSKKLKEAHEKVKKAERDLDTVRKHGFVLVTETDKKTGELTSHILTQKEAEKNLAEAKDEEIKQTSKYNKAQQAAYDIIEQLGSSISSLGNSIGGTAGMIVSLIGDVVSFASNTVTALGRTTEGVSAAIQAVEKASAILAIISAAIQIVMKIADIAKSLFGADDGEQFEKAKSRYEALSDVWDELINKKREYLDESWGKEAKAATDEIIRLLEAEQKQAEILARQRLEVTNGSHSMWYRMWQGSYKSSIDDNIGALNEGVNLNPWLRSINWRDVNKAIEQGLREAGLGDVTFNAMEDMLTFTSEQLDWIKTNYTGLWTAMDDDFRELLEKHASLTGDMEEAIKAMQERMTGTTAENVIEDFMESLYDLADGSADALDDVAKNWQQMVNRMAVNTLVTQELKERLTKWYENLAKIEEDYTSGIISETEYRNRLNAAQTEYNNTLEESRQKMESLRDMGIVKAVEETVEEITESFSDIRDAWVSTVMGMKGDTESLGKDIARIMFEQLVNSNVMNDSFDEWLKDWVKRYEEALNVAAPGERASRLAQLEEERKNKVDELTEATKRYADAAGYAAEADSEFTSSLDNLGDTLLDALLDADMTAEDMGKKIAQDLIREMLTEMLATEKYSGRLAEIRQMWQDILTGADKEHTYEDVLREIAALNNDIANDDAISGLADQYKLLGESTDEAKSSFEGLRSTVKNSLTDVNATAEDFRKQLEKTLVGDLVDKMVLDVPITIGEVDYKSFDEFSEKWNERYLKALEEGNTEAINLLMEELVQARNITAEAAEEYTKRLKEATKDTTFADMESSFVSALMNMDGDISDFAENMKETIVRKLIESFMVSERIKPMLEALQDTLDYVMGRDDLSMQERAELMVWGDAEHNGISEFEQDMSDMKTFVEGVMTSIGFTAKNTGEEVAGLFDNLGDSIAESLASSDGSVDDLMKNLTQSIVTELAKGYLATEEMQQKLADVKKGLEDAVKSGNPAKILEAQQAVRDFYSEAEKGAKAYKEALIQVQQEHDTTFKDMSGDFVSALMDMNSTAEDWASQIGRTMAQRIIEQLVVTAQIQPLLDSLQEVFNAAMEAPGATWQSVMGSSQVQQKLLDIKNAFPGMQEMAKSIMEALGVSFGEATEDVKEGFSDLRSAFVNTLTDMEADAGTFGKNIGDTMRQQMIDRLIDKKYGKQLEQMNDAWAEALEAGDTKKMKEIADYLEHIYSLIADDKEIKQLADSLKQVQEQADTTFKDMKDSFVSSLMNLEASADDFGQQIGETLVRRIVEQMMVAKYIQPLLDNLQNAVDKAMSAEGATPDSVLGDAGVLEMIDRIRVAYPKLAETVSGLLEKVGITAENAEESVEKPLGNLKDTFVGFLTDLEATAEDFGKQIGETLIEEMLQEVLASEYYTGRFDEIRQHWAEALKGEGGHTIDSVTQEILDLEKAMSADENITSLQEALKKLHEEAEDIVEDSTFKDMSDSWTQMLTDMNASAEDWGKEIGRTLVSRMVKELVVTKHLQSYLDAIQEAADDAITKYGDSEDAMAKIVEAVTPAINDAVKATEKWKPVVDAVNEAFQDIEDSVSETPFDNLRSSFLSSLMDMEADTKDFADDIGKILTEAFIDKFVLGDKFDEMVKEWQKRYSDIMGDKGISPEERTRQLKDLKSAISDARASLAEDAKAIHELMGTNNVQDQSAYMNTASQITYDQADIIGGGVMSLVIGQAEANEVRKQILSTLQAMSGITSPNSEAFAEIAEGISMTNNWLRNIYDVVDKIRQSSAISADAANVIASKL